MLNAVEKNIIPPDSEKCCLALSEGWAAKSKSKKGFDIMPGTILAGDGLVIEIKAPTDNDRREIDMAKYKNRKGFFGVIVQAFCDVDTKFHFWECYWPGATPDLTAYKQTSLFSRFDQGRLPTWAHLVLDEAYSSIGGNHHLTPFSRNQLIKCKDEDGDQEYCKLKAFNNMLSSQRITIERAFGILIRRWGILWKPLEYKIAHVTLIIQVCAKLHNRCIDSWKRSTSRKGQRENLEPLEHGDDWSCFLRNCHKRSSNIDVPTDDEIINVLSNRLKPGNLTYAKRRDHCPKRELLVKYIYDHGIRFDSRAENDFTLRK